MRAVIYDQFERMAAVVVAGMNECGLNKMGMCVSPVWALMNSFTQTDRNKPWFDDIFLRSA